MMPGEFWDLTMHESVEWLNARRLEVADLNMMVAWYGANFQRAKKMPELAKVLPSKQADNKKPHDPVEVARQIRATFMNMAGKA